VGGVSGASSGSSQLISVKPPSIDAAYRVPPHARSHISDESATSVRMSSKALRFSDLSHPGRSHVHV
jgi:hypothetical protein